MDTDRIRASLEATVRVVEDLAGLAPAIQEAGAALAATVLRDGKILLCGNGGSAADAQHFATELTVRYLEDRRALPALALTTDSSTLTAAANDLGFARVFARQVEAFGRSGDALVAISTSGDSPNVVAAVREARDRGLVTVGLTGVGGGEVGPLVEHWLAVPSDHTPRIQEGHLVIEHLLCEIVEQMAGSGS